MKWAMIQHTGQVLQNAVIDDTNHNVYLVYNPLIGIIYAHILGWAGSGLNNDLIEIV